MVEELVRVFPDGEGAIVDFAGELFGVLPRSGPVVFVCIGTDRVTGDAFGPIVGSLLRETRFLGDDVHVWGDLRSPIHAKNLAERLQAIECEHAGAFVVGIDSSVSADFAVGTVAVRRGPVIPGVGVGNPLPGVGNASITGCVAANRASLAVPYKPLGDVWRMSSFVASGITFALAEREARADVAATR